MNQNYLFIWYEPELHRVRDAWINNVTLKSLKQKYTQQSSLSFTKQFLGLDMYIGSMYMVKPVLNWKESIFVDQSLFPCRCFVMTLRNTIKMKWIL